MAFDLFLADRIRQLLCAKKVAFYEKKMMGGLVFMVNTKMCCGIHIDKQLGDSLLMVKIGVTEYQKEIIKPVCLPMDFTGRPMKGYIFITPQGFDLDADLEYWIDKGLDFNLKNQKA